MAVSIGMATTSLLHEWSQCENLGNIAENTVIQVSAITSSTIIVISSSNPGALTPVDQMLTPTPPQNYVGYIINEGDTFQFTVRGIGADEWVLWGYAGSSTADSLVSVSILA